LPEDALIARLRAALGAGARLVQFRAKGIERGELLRRAERVQAVCREYQALFLVNDAADVAAILAADGLHLGQDDLPAAAARTLLGPDMLVGLSISALEEAELAPRDGTVDYLGVGAMFPTDTKPDAEYGGPELLQSIRAATDLPLVAIGGITAQNAAAVWSAGADLIAVVSAVFSANDPAAATQALLSSRPRQ
jgi:thiamine-phosphate diphosphorylase